MDKKKMLKAGLLTLALSVAMIARPTVASASCDSDGSGEDCDATVYADTACYGEAGCDNLDSDPGYGGTFAGRPPTDLNQDEQDTLSGMGGSWQNNSSNCDGEAGCN